MKKQLLLCAGILLIGNLSGCSSHAAKETTDTSGATNDVSIVSVSEPEDVEGFVTPIASSDFEKDTASEAAAGQDSTDSESVDTPNIEDLWWESIDGGLRILGYEGSEQELIIPEEIDGQPVIEIGERAFYQNKTLIRVELPDTVKEISEWSFQFCENLEEIDFGNGVETIKESAFYGCIFLNRLDFPNTLKEIGISAFMNDENLVEINFSEGLQKINLLSFAGCTALKEVRIPESVESIGESAFEGIQGLTMIGAEGSAAEQFAVNQGLEFRVEEM